MVEKPIYIQKELNFKKPAPDAVLDVITASGLLPADYCQLERPFYLQRTRTELVWKSDMWFGDKALGLKATLADVIHYCQLGKMDVKDGSTELPGEFTARSAPLRRSTAPISCAIGFNSAALSWRPPAFQLLLAGVARAGRWWLPRFEPLADVDLRPVNKPEAQIFWPLQWSRDKQRRPREMFSLTHRSAFPR